MKIAYIYLSLLIMIVSCDSSDSEMNLRQVFSEEEIKQLESIEMNFQSYLESKYNCKKHDCYNKYIEYLYSFEKDGNLMIEFPKSNLKKIFDATDQTLLNEIWLDYTNEKDKYLYLNKDGKYYKFVNLLSNSNKNVKNYIDSYDKIADYSPSLVAKSIPIFVKEDFSNKELRIFKAIHFISCSHKSNQ